MRILGLIFFIFGFQFLLIEAEIGNMVSRVVIGTLIAVGLFLLTKGDSDDLP